MWIGQQQKFYVEEDHMIIDEAGQGVDLTEIVNEHKKGTLLQAWAQC